MIVIENTPLIFWEDAGHGWMAVPEEHIKYLGIENDITSYSYHYQGTVYLEEDQDLGTYLKARHEQGWDNELYESYKTSIRKWAGDQAVIRRYPSYKGVKP